MLYQLSYAGNPCSTYNLKELLTLLLYQLVAGFDCTLLFVAASTARTFSFFSRMNIPHRCVYVHVPHASFTPLIGAPPSIARVPKV